MLLTKSKNMPFFVKKRSRDTTLSILTNKSLNLTGLFCFKSFKNWAKTDVFLSLEKTN